MPAVRDPMRFRNYLRTLIAVLLVSGANAAYSNSMDPALIASAAAGDTPRVIELLRKGANVNARDLRGRTPVMAATYGNHVRTVEALVNAGADINRRDMMLNNPFLYAGAEGLLDILRLTVKASADPAITNRYGGTALIPAAHRGHVESVNYLLSHTRVNVNHVNALGWTALLEAIVLSDGGLRHQQIIAALIRHGADVNLPDRWGRTPLQLARERGYTAIQALLEAAGAHRRK